MSDKERIIQIINFSGISANKFAKTIGVGQSTIQSAIDPNKTVKPGMSIIKGILELYPNLNSRWLILGEGEMWNENKNYDEIYNKYLSEKETVALLKQNKKLLLKILRDEHPDVMENLKQYI